MADEVKATKLCKAQKVEDILQSLCMKLADLEEEALAVFGTLISNVAASGALSASGGTGGIPALAAIVSVPGLLALQQSFLGVLTSLSRLLCELIRNPCCLTCQCLRLVLCSISEAIVFLDVLQASSGSLTTGLSALFAKIIGELKGVQATLKQLPPMVCEGERCESTICKQTVCASVQAAAFNVFLADVSAAATVTTQLAAFGFGFPGQVLLPLTHDETASAVRRRRAAALAAALEAFAAQVNLLVPSISNPGCASGCCVPVAFAQALLSIARVLSCFANLVAMAIPTITTTIPEQLPLFQLGEALLSGTAQGLAALAACLPLNGNDTDKPCGKCACDFTALNQAAAVLLSMTGCTTSM